MIASSFPYKSDVGKHRKYAIYILRAMITFMFSEEEENVEENFSCKFVNFDTNSNVLNDLPYAILYAVLWGLGLGDDVYHMFCLIVITKLEKIH